MDLAIKLIVLLPLLAAAIAGFFSAASIGDRPAQIVTCGALLIAAALAIFVFLRHRLSGRRTRKLVVPIATWIAAGGVDVDWSLRVDTLTGGHDPGRHHRVVDGPCLLGRLHGGRPAASRASWPISACSPSSC